MKVTCNRTALLEAVLLAAGIAPTRTPKPILQCTKLEADQDQQSLTVIATDNEIAIRYLVPQVEVQQSGCAVIPADRLGSILRESSEDTLVLEMVEATCQITGNDSMFHIYGHDPDDFPEVAVTDAENGIELEAGPLGQMIARTIFAAAKENNRYAINGVLWEIIGKKMNLVATDGRRLAKVEASLKTAVSDEEITGIVPIKTMSVLDRVLHDPQETITIAFTGNQVVIKTALAQVCGTLMQGRFPKYQDVIPAKSERKINVGTAALQSAVRRAALLINENSKGIELMFAQNLLCLSSSAPEAGDAEIKMPIEYDDEEFKIGFNPQYILDMLKVVQDDTIVMELSGSNKQGLLRAGKDFLYVVMPVSV